jgi:hypothetical protein
VAVNSPIALQLAADPVWWPFQLHTDFWHWSGAFQPGQPILEQQSENPEPADKRKKHF